MAPSMDYLPHFRREARAFEDVARAAVGVEPAPMVPTCPDWAMGDLIVHLGSVHRYVARLVRERLTEQPAGTDLGFLQLPEDVRGWPRPEEAPNRGPVPGTLVDWYAEGVAALAGLFSTSPDTTPVWTWSSDQTVGFWKRMQTIEASVHRWDAERTAGRAPRAVDGELAADAVSQTFEYMVEARRKWREAPPGAGERFAFHRTDGPESWHVTFEDTHLHLHHGPAPADLELSGTASDLMLFLWRRIPSHELPSAKGDPSLPDRYFTLAPPI
ncbi:maleylpyruvate isomerase family mycothiol-dependent enzyme [Streptomyces sp. ODS28]|uniref:maleylpyruvate isomerase family mycothiol-dependent enzyme n=1 Tax=Streptomyces sp. ODS28 TaxID=3136688 RepID=UPI0031E8B784